MSFGGLKIISGVIFAAYFQSCDEFLTHNTVFGGNLPASSTSGGSSSSGGGSSDVAPDDDADGLSNETEQSFGLDPHTADTDHDGIDDGLEFVGRLGDPLNSRLSPTPFNRKRILLPDNVIVNDSDSDGDGLGDQVEAQLGTDSEKADTDDDGYSDALEEIAGSNPLSASSRPVRPAAPVSDGTPTGVAPLDSDGDGIADSLEALNGGRVNAKDSDGDGYSDGIEFIMGSDPADNASVPDFTAGTTTSASGG